MDMAWPFAGSAATIWQIARQAWDSYPVAGQRPTHLRWDRVGCPVRHQSLARSNPRPDTTPTALSLKRRASPTATAPRTRSRHRLTFPPMVSLPPAVEPPPTTPIAPQSVPLHCFVYT